VSLSDILENAFTTSCSRTWKVPKCSGVEIAKTIPPHFTKLPPIYPPHVSTPTSAQSSDIIIACFACSSTNKAPSPACKTTTEDNRSTAKHEQDTSIPALTALAYRPHMETLTSRCLYLISALRHLRLSIVYKSLRLPVDQPFLAWLRPCCLRHSIQNGGMSAFVSGWQGDVIA